MECNRDEANRAKELAESKLSKKDIMGAKKFALKAQTLYPPLEGIAQLLAVLDIYVSVEYKLNGELDYYKILGVSPTADDETIRKSYRKLALSLHPDKNKSIGAEGAFQYVSEAWNLLSDKDKRMAYDYRRNGRVFKQRAPTQNGYSRPPPPPQPPRPPPQPPTQNGFHNFTKGTTAKAQSTTHRAPPPPPPTTTTTTKTKVSTTQTKSNINATTKTVPVSVSVSSSSNKQMTPKTFWTVCKRCKLQYEFVRMYLNRNLICPTCHGPFLATEFPPPDIKTSSEAVENTQGSSKTGSNPTQWSPFSKTNSPTAVSIAETMVKQAYEKVKREREEAQAAAKKEQAKRRKIAKKADKSSSKDLKSVNKKHDVDVFGGIKETGPVGSSISSTQTDVTKDVTKKRLIKKATTEIKKKLSEWRGETDDVSIVRGVESGNTSLADFKEDDDKMDVEE